MANTSLQYGAHALEFKQGEILLKYVRQSLYIAWGKVLLAWIKCHANGCFRFRPQLLCLCCTDSMVLIGLELMVYDKLSSILSSFFFFFRENTFACQNYRTLRCKIYCDHSGVACASLGIDLSFLQGEVPVHLFQCFIQSQSFNHNSINYITVSNLHYLY